MNDRPDFRGLGARLFGRTSEQTDNHPVDGFLDDSDANRVVLLPIDSIRPNPDQPRKFFKQSAHDDLTASIREHGVIEPVIARKTPDGGGYVLIAGERRFRAAKAAGLIKIPAIIRQKDDPAEVALIENLQREDLTPLELAEGLLKLKETRSYSDEALAAVIGKSRVTVNELLSLNKLPEDIKDACRTSDSLSKSQLLTLARAGSEPAIRSGWNALNAGGATTTRQLRSRNRAAKGRPDNYRFNYSGADHRYRVTVTFNKARVSPAEVQEALTDAIHNLNL
jgi:ParB family chromosome partitioning protein